MIITEVKLMKLKLTIITLFAFLISFTFSTSFAIATGEVCRDIEVGDFCSQTQGGWGSVCSGGNPGCLRDANFDSVTGGTLVVGIGFNITFTDSEAVENYLPEGMPPMSLTQSHIDPTTTESNVFGGQVTALKLNVLFSDAGIGLSEPASEIPIGDLFIASGKFEGLTVNEFLEIAEKVLGGDTSDLGGFSATISDVNEAATSINENFVDCETDGGFLEIRECPTPKGSITVCKIIIDPDRNVVNGSDIPGAVFSISGFSPETSQPDAVGEIGTTEWVTPLSFNANLLGDDEIDDAECTTYSDLEIGGYFYTNETFPAEGWEDPLYNDQHKTAVSTLDDFFPYDDKLFDEDPENDGERDTNVDGHITLTNKRPDRTLVILNQYEIVPFCGDGTIDEGEQCDDGNNENGDGCSTTCELEQVVCEFGDPIIIDFEGFPAGTIIDDEYSGSGISISAVNNHGSHPDLATIFNSSDPTGDDFDLGTPNEDFGGPGIGTGDGAGDGNTFGLGNILIIAENDQDTEPADGLIDDPDDEARGGQIIIDLDEPVTIQRVIIVDIDKNENGGSVKAFDEIETEILAMELVGTGDNSVIILNSNLTNYSATKIVINLTGSGALGELTLCEKPPVCEPPRSEKIIGEPLCKLEEGEWINSETEISFESFPGEGVSCPDIDGTFYRISLVNNEACESVEICQQTDGEGNWTEFTQPFTVGEESCRLIEHFANDTEGNTEEIQKQCVFVDNTPPVGEKIIGEPKEIWEGDNTFFANLTERCWGQGEDALECWTVTLDTPIDISCSDPQPHPVGHEVVAFRVEVDGDNATEFYCGEYLGEMGEDGFCRIADEDLESFFFLELSQHNLEYFCEDKLGNAGEIDEEKFKVERDSFKIFLNKKWNLISVPFALIDDSVEIVFEDIEDDIASVWTYNATTDTWFVYTPDGIENDNLESILSGWGYWVLATNDTMFTIGGSLFQHAITPPSKVLIEGWNLIGYYGNDEIIDDIKKVYNGPVGAGRLSVCALGSLISTEFGNPLWSALVTYWELDNPDAFHFLDFEDNMDPGAGYWLFIDEDEIYAFSTVCLSE